MFITTVSRQCELSFEPVIKCVSRKGKKTTTNKYTKVGKRCFNLNHRPQSAFDDRTELFAFTGIPVTIYSTSIELSHSVIVLGITPQNLRKNPGGAVDRNRSSPGCHF